MNASMVKAQKWMIWLVFIGILYLLRSLFSVIFLTFILSFIANSAVRFMGRWSPFRRLNLTIVAVVFVFLSLGLASFVLPRIGGEARDLARGFIRHQQAVEAATDTTMTPHVAAPAPEQDTGTMLARETRAYLDQALARLLGNDALVSFRETELYDDLIYKIEETIEDLVPFIVTSVKKFLNSLLALAFHFLISLIFSYIILWDLPNLARGLQSFSSGRTAAVYAEIAPGVRALAVMLGRAFEAQSGIAVVNALLTAVGFLLLGIPSIALLSTIVFFCSYIPVLGVILSSLPAALLAFKAGGIIKIFWLVFMIMLVHAIEAYGLNPLIYGHHLRMHPIAVLVILLVGEHLFGVWGLLLGVPIMAFVLQYVIRGDKV